MVSAKRINEVMSTETVIKNGENIKRPHDNVKGEVVFDHVSFAYPGADGGFTSRRDLYGT